MEPHWLGLSRGAWAAVALLLWLPKGVESIRRGDPTNLLWACNLGLLLLGPSLLLSARLPASVILLWLSLGLPFWFLDLAGGAEFLVSSLLVHIGGLVAALAGARLLGLEPGGWWKALAALAILQAVSRFAAPPEKNVNICRSIWAGWERIFPSYPYYWVALTATAAATFFVSQVIVARSFRA